MKNHVIPNILDLVTRTGDVAATCGEVSWGVLSGLGLQPCSLDPERNQAVQKWIRASSGATSTASGCGFLFCCFFFQEQIVLFP